MKLLGWALIVAAATSPTTPANLWPNAASMVAAVRDSYVRVETEQAKLPKATTVSEKLERLLERDQAGRSGMGTIDVGSLPEAERPAAYEAIGNEIHRHDLEDQETLKSLIPADGWFKESIYGEKATKAAFLVVQHAVNDPPLMRRTLQKLGEYVPQGEAKGQMYALMYDRVALEFDQKPQRYGSQVGCEGGVWKPKDLEDPEHVDERRAQMGMKETEAVYLKRFADSPC